MTEAKLFKILYQKNIKTVAFCDFRTYNTFMNTVFEMVTCRAYCVSVLHEAGSSTLTDHDKMPDFPYMCSILNTEKL